MMVLTNNSISATLLSTLIIEVLKHIQIRDGLTNQQFADKIGIHRVSWLKIKAYRAGIGNKFLSGVRQAYPELKDAIDIFLSKDASIQSINAIEDITTTSPEKAYNGCRGGFRQKVISILKKLIKRA